MSRSHQSFFNKSESFAYVLSSTTHRSSEVRSVTLLSFKDRFMGFSMVAGCNVRELFFSNV